MTRLHKQIVPSVHAYLLEGWWTDVGDTLTKSVSDSLGKDVRVVCLIEDSIGIDNVRRIVELETRKSGSPESYILACRTITKEAQNALLKASEDPTSGKYLFIVVPSAISLLSTLRSRLMPLEYERVSSNDELVDKFLSVKQEDRFEILEDVVKDKDAAAAQRFFDCLLSKLYENMNGDQKASVGDYKMLEEILQARRFISSRGASLKLLLQHVALVVPCKSV